MPKPNQYEAAARALFEAAKPIAKWEELSGHLKEIFYFYAKAAIEAHQQTTTNEPTPTRGTPGTDQPNSTSS